MTENKSKISSKKGIEHLQNTTAIFTSLKEICDKIIKKCTPIMKQLASEDNHIIESVLESYSEDECPATKEQILLMARDHAYYWQADAYIIRQELDVFVGDYISGSQALEETSCNFLKSVWFGDIYGDTEMDSIQCLIDEQRRIYSTIDDDLLVEEINKSITANKHSEESKNT
jgi:hypothetical protein